MNKPDNVKEQLKESAPFLTDEVLELLYIWFEEMQSQTLAKQFESAKNNQNLRELMNNITHSIVHKEPLS